MLGEGYPDQKTKMEDKEKKTFTVQGVGNPVPAELLSEQAGSTPSRSNNRNSPVKVPLTPTLVAVMAEASVAAMRNSTLTDNGKATVGVSASGGVIVSPFERSNIMQRSPIKSDIINKRPRSSPPNFNGANEHQSEIQVHKRQCDNDRRNNYTGGPSSVPSTLTNFQKLGAQIRSLADMLEDGKRRSIHQPMRDAIESIKNFYKLVEMEAHVGATSVERKTSFSQTSPLQKQLQVPKKKEISRCEAAETAFHIPRYNPASRVRKALPAEVGRLKVPTPEKAKPTETNDVQANPHDSETKKAPQTSNVEGWQTVRRKRGKMEKMVRSLEVHATKRRWKTPRPDAIIISKTGVDSYADILKKMKANSELNELGEQVNKIRKTAKGELLLELKRGNCEGHDQLRQHAEKVLANLANVRSVSQEILIECRDIDEVTTQEEICTAIQDQFTTIGPVNSSAIKYLRPTRYGTQTALISLPARSAQILIKAGRIRIGWVRCRLRERITLTRCFRCLEYGHVARACKGEVDRTGVCFKCGEKGHVAKACEKPPKCVLCKPDCAGGNKHPSGNMKCPAYKKALEVVTTRND